MRPLLIAAALAALAPTTAHADRVVARLPGESPISAYRDVAVVSVLHRDVFRLAVIRHGKLRELPVPESTSEFDADVGPDSRGRPIVAYSRYDGRDREGCDLFVHRLGRASEERVETASTEEQSEFEPAIWRGRIAYAQGENGEKAAVVTRSRLTPRTVAAEPVQGVPRDASVVDVDVRRRLVATTVLREPDLAAQERGSQEIRVHALDGRTTPPVASLSAGEGGQTLIGLGFAGDRHLAWHLTCFGDPGGCDRGATRYDIERRTLEHDPVYRGLSGFALVPGGAWEVRAGGDEVGDNADVIDDPSLGSPCGDFSNASKRATCPVVRADPPRWRPGGRP